MKLEKEVEKHWNNLFSKYISPWHKWWDKYPYIHLWGCGGKEKIRELLKKGCKIKCRYSASSVREAHNYLIFIIKKGEL